MSIGGGLFVAGQPLHYEEVLRTLGSRLTEYERAEIREYAQVYWAGETADKPRATLLPGENNHGYDDDRADYKVVPHDHLLYRYASTNPNPNPDDRADYKVVSHDRLLYHISHFTSHGITSHHFTSHHITSLHMKVVPHDRLLYQHAHAAALAIDMRPPPAPHHPVINSPTPPCHRSYEIIDVVGKGSFGQVVRAYDHKAEQVVAVKVIRNKQRFHKQALVEAQVLALTRTITRIIT